MSHVKCARDTCSAKKKTASGYCFQKKNLTGYSYIAARFSSSCSRRIFGLIGTLVGNGCNPYKRFAGTYRPIPCLLYLIYVPSLASAIPVRFSPASNSTFTSVNFTRLRYTKYIFPIRVRISEKNVGRTPKNTANQRWRGGVFSL